MTLTLEELKSSGGENFAIFAWKFRPCLAKGRSLEHSRATVPWISVPGRHPRANSAGFEAVFAWRLSWEGSSLLQIEKLRDRAGLRARRTVTIRALAKVEAGKLLVARSLWMQVPVETSVFCICGTQAEKVHIQDRSSYFDHSP